MTASDLASALAVLRAANLGSAAASLIANNRQAAVALRNRHLLSTGCPPATLWRAYNHYRSTTWTRTKTSTSNPHPEGLEHVIWEVLKLVDKDITPRYMRMLLERK